MTAPTRAAYRWLRLFRPIGHQWLLWVICGGLFLQGVWWAPLLALFGIAIGNYRYRYERWGV